MSVSGYEQDRLFDRGSRPLRARKAGMFAATMIGGSAVLALLACLAFAKPGTETAASSTAAAPQGEAAATLASVVAGESAFPFELTAPEFTEAKKSTATRKLDAGGREDSLTLGEFAPSAPYLRLDLTQSTGAKRSSPDFFLDMTRHAAQAGLGVVGKINPPAPFASRFGAFEAAEIRLSLAAGDGAPAERACQAFRLAGSKQALEIAGFVCGAAKPLDRRALGCLIDRLDYRAGGENPALDQFFKATDDGRGKACGGTTTLGSEKADWLEAHSSAPAAKGDSLPPKHTKKAH